MMRKITTDPPNPSGLCMCGCGQPTPIATRGCTRQQMVMGYPQRFIYNHHLRLKRTRVGYLIDPATDCWIWQGSKDDKGYGHLQRNGQGGKFEPAHKHYWQKKYGPVPNGLVLDHAVCQNPSCVNPDHLEPVTHGENSRRGRGTKLTEPEVRAIRETYPDKSMLELAKIYGVGPSAIYSIISYRTWADVAIVPIRRLPFSDIASRAVRKRATTKLTIEKAREIRGLYPQMNQYEIAEKFGVSQTTVYSVVNQRSWREPASESPLKADT